MTGRRKALSLTAMAVLTAGGAAAWAMAPAKGRADTPVAAQQQLPPDLWAKGPVDRGNMVQGILDYRSDAAQR